MKSHNREMESKTRTLQFWLKFIKIKLNQTDRFKYENAQVKQHFNFVEITKKKGLQ